MHNGSGGMLKERRKPPVSDRNGFKIFPFRQAFLKPQNTRRMSTRRGTMHYTFYIVGLLLFEMYGTERSSVSHMKHQVKFTNERVLTTLYDGRSDRM